MNNNNGMPGNAELIALANRRREQLKKAEEEKRLAEQSRPQPPLQAQPTPQSRPQPRPQPRPLPHARPQPRPENTQRAEGAAEEAKKRQLEEKKRRDAEARARTNAEKKKKAAEARVIRDQAAAERRIRRSNRAKATREKLSKLREDYRGVAKDAVAYFAVFLCLILILCTACAAIILLRMLNYADNADLPERITVTFNGKKQKFDYGEIVRDGIYYVNFKTVAELCELSQSGDKIVTIYTAPNGEQIRFSPPPSRTVLINGNPLSVEGDCILVNGELWVPLSLISEYFLGIGKKRDSGEARTNRNIAGIRDRKVDHAGCGPHLQLGKSVGGFV